MKHVVPFLMLAFVVCGMGGMYCPMPASATEAHHSPPDSQHSSSSQTPSDCPEQLVTSGGFFEHDDVPFDVLTVTAFTWFDEILNLDVLTFLGNDNTPRATTYPLLFLLFAVFLN